MGLHAINSLVIIIMFGSLVLLGFLNLTNALRVNRQGNFYFGLMLLAWASFWLEEIAGFASFEISSSILTWILSCFQILTPLFLYLSIRFYSYPNYRFSLKDLKHFIIPAIFLTLHIVKLQSIEKISILNTLLAILIFYQAFFYLVLSYIQTRKHRVRLNRFESSLQGRNLKWFEYILMQVFIICTTALISNLLGHEAPGIFMNIANLVVVFIVAYQSIGQKEIYNINNNSEADLDYLEERPERRKLMPDSELAMLKHELENVMTTRKPYLDSNINLVKMAEMLDISAHQLSYIINTGFNVSFFQFINQYRVERAKKLLLQNSNNFTILAIAFESGFNSKTAFNSTFKKITGQTPTQFISRQKG